MLRACSKSVLYKRATERKSRGLELCEDEGDFFSLWDLYLYTNNVYLVNRLNSDMRGVSSENVHPLEDHLPRLIQIYTKYWLKMEIPIQCMYAYRCHNNYGLHYCFGNRLNLGLQCCNVYCFHITNSNWEIQTF